MATKKIISHLSLSVSAPLSESATALFAVNGVQLQIAQPITARAGIGNDIMRIPLAIAGNPLADGSASENDNIAYNLIRKKIILKE